MHVSRSLVIVIRSGLSMERYTEQNPRRYANSSLIMRIHVFVILVENIINYNLSHLFEFFLEIKFAL